MKNTDLEELESADPDKNCFCRWKCLIVDLKTEILNDKISRYILAQHTLYKSYWKDSTDFPNSISNTLCRKTKRTGTSSSSRRLRTLRSPSISAFLVSVADMMWWTESYVASQGKRTKPNLIFTHVLYYGWSYVMACARWCPARAFRWCFQQFDWRQPPLNESQQLTCYLELSRWAVTVDWLIDWCATLYTEKPRSIPISTWNPAATA